MKITAKQYALALDDSLKGKDKDGAKNIIRKFVALLAKNNDWRKINDIIKNFVANLDKQEGIANVEIISARALATENIKLLEKYVKGISGATKLAWSEKIDSSLLGGVIIKYGDRVIDASLKNEITQFKNHLIK